MRLYYKTPWYKNSSFMAHMVEHILLHPNNVDDLDTYMYRSNIDWYSSSEHIYFVYDEFLMDENRLKNTLNMSTVTQEMIDYEYSIFEEEFGSRSYILRFIDKFYQNKYGADWSSKPVKYTVDEIKDYINKYIINGQHAFFDRNNDKLCSTNIKYDLVNCAESYPKFTYEMILLQWSKNHTFYKKIESVYDFILQSFVSKLFTEYDLYQKRYILWSYYHSPCTSFNNSEYIVLRNSTDNISDVSNDFFESFKKYYIDLVNNNQFEANNLSWIAYASEYTSKEEIAKYIQNISYSYIKNLVEMIER